MNFRTDIDHSQDRFLVGYQPDECALFRRDWETGGLAGGTVMGEAARERHRPQPRMYTVTVADTPVVAERLCARCGEPFLPKQNGQKFCTEVCRKRAAQNAWRERRRAGGRVKPGSAARRREARRQQMVGYNAKRAAA